MTSYGPPSISSFGPLVTTFTGTVKSPFGLFTTKPLLRTISARFSRSSNVTSAAPD